MRYQLNRLLCEPVLSVLSFPPIIWAGAFGSILPSPADQQEG